MYRCSVCGSEHTRRSELEPRRDANGFWLMLCDKCRAAAAEGLDVTGAEAIISEVTRQLKELRKSDHDAQILRFYQREYERKETHLEIRFSLSRDEELHTGVVLDISEGGLRFRTRREVQRGQIVRLSLAAADADQETSDKLQSTAELRRVTPLPDGSFEVGARFVKHIRGHAANRRRHARYKANLAVYYYRQGSEYIGKGLVRDLSTGGLRAVFPEPFDEEERLRMRLRGESAPVRKVDLEAEVRVIRKRQIAEGEFEISGEFLRIKPPARPPENK